MTTKLQSIRWRLPLTYAGIALLTSLVLGGGLLVVLRDYYAAQERQYLRENAAAMQPIITQMRVDGLPAEAMNQPLDHFAFLAHSRLRLLDSEQAVLVDTGDQEIRREVVVNLTGAVNQREWMLSGGGGGQMQTAILPLPVPELAPPGIASQRYEDAGLVSFFTIGDAPRGDIAFTGSGGDNILSFGGQGESASISVERSYPLALYGNPYGGYRFFNERVENNDPLEFSTQVYTIALKDSQNQTWGYLEVSGSPALGTTIINTVQINLIRAGLLATLLAAFAGWLVSHNLTQPVLTLAHATEQMAQGNLSARVQLKRKDELGRLADSFNEMAERVETTVASLKRFVADAAHELNTPITAIQTNLELAANQAEGYVVYVNQARAQLTRLEALTDNLLDLARLESHAEKPHYQRVNVGVLVRQIGEWYASRAEQADIEFSLATPDVALETEGNPQQLSRVVENLLDNALKFTPSAGKVSLLLQAETNSICLEVCDTGIGIPTPDQPQIFNRFHRGSNVASYAGSGLGLLLTKTIVEQHQGQIAFTSTPSGTQFRITLPLAKEAHA